MRLDENKKSLLFIVGFIILTIGGILSGAFIVYKKTPGNLVNIRKPTINNRDFLFSSNRILIVIIAG